MSQLTMYPAQVNSPQTELSASISDTAVTIPVVDASLLPAAPNLLVIGTDETAETILFTGKSGNNLTGVTRGVEGVAKSWTNGAKIARNYTASDYEAMRHNIADHEARLSAAEDDLVVQQADILDVQTIASAALPAATYTAADVLAKLKTVDGTGSGLDTDLVRGRVLETYFGAIATAGTLNWNDTTNIRPGSGYTLLDGMATNGPGVAGYYHPFNLEFGSLKDGTSTITQLAIPYNLASNPSASMYMRTRYNGTWTSWIKYWGTNELRINAGALEFNDGGTWTPVGGAGVSVASANIHYNDPTERILSSTSMNILVCKIAPAFTGEMVLSFDLMPAAVGGVNTVVTLCLPAISNSGVNQMAGRQVGLDWRTPLDTIVNQGSFVNITTSTLTNASPGTQAYTTYTHVINAYAGVPLYLTISGNAQAGAQSRIRNIQLKYDIVRG